MKFFAINLNNYHNNPWTDASVNCEVITLEAKSLKRAKNHMRNYHPQKSFFLTRCDSVQNMVYAHETTEKQITKELFYGKKEVKDGNTVIYGDFRIMHIFLCGIGVVGIRVILSMISELYKHRKQQTKQKVNMFHVKH